MSAVTASLVFASLWDAVWQHRRRTLLALALLLLAKLAAVGVPLLLKAIVDRFSVPNAALAVPAPALGGAPSTLLVVPVFLLLGYALLRFAGTLFTELRDLAFARVAKRTVMAFAERTYGHLLELSPRFHVQRHTGALIRDVERGTAGVGFLLGAGLFTLLPTLVEFVAVLLVMAVGYSLWFTLVIVVTFFVYAGWTMVITERRQLHQRRVNEVDSRASGRMVDSLLNVEAVKGHAREGWERQRYAALMRDWVDSSVANQQALSLLHIGQAAIIAAGVAAVMLLAGQLTVQGRMTVGDLVLVNAYVIQICLPLNALGFVFREARDALVNTEKLFGLLQQPVEIADASGAPPLRLDGAAVAFERVDFGYEPGRQVLFGIDLAIAPGATVAVVGGSGSGKSTLARLLLRLYDASGGRIAIDGQDIRGVALQSLRDAIGVVPQDTVLFNDTIAYNIGYGRLGASLPEIIEAAKAAQVHEFIVSLPAGYDTVVGERGLKLSGGEKQRIAIARALLKNPPILIFDEATSALDTRAERAIQRELDRIAQGRTTLIVAHRLSTVVDADEIVVLDQGRIVERGRHDALLQRGGLYAQLWNLQLQQREFERLERRLARQPVDLARLVAEAIGGTAAAFDARGVRLYGDVALAEAQVLGDPSTLSAALLALLDGALRATPPGGRVELSLRRAGADARLVVSDGRHLTTAAPGPDPPGAAGVRVSDGPAPLDPLQLRSAIERQGGRFAVEPPGAGHGMRYVVELPLHVLAAPVGASARAAAGAQGAAEASAGALDAAEASAAADAQVAAAAQAAPTLAGLRILCIDDRDDARQALQLLLEDAGADVLPFAGGAAALDWLRRQPGGLWPHLLLADISLADGESGHDVMRAIRRLESERGVPLQGRLPAVALSGHAEAGDRVAALMAGFQAHLAKPVMAGELIATVRALTAGHPSK